MKNKINTIHGNREASDLVFQGKVEKQWEVLFGQIGLLGGALAGMKKFKAFIVIQAKSDHKFTYQIRLGDERNRRVTHR